MHTYIHTYMLTVFRNVAYIQSYIHTCIHRHIHAYGISEWLGCPCIHTVIHTYIDTYMLTVFRNGLVVLACNIYSRILGCVCICMQTYMRHIMLYMYACIMYACVLHVCVYVCIHCNACTQDKKYSC